MFFIKKNKNVEEQHGNKISLKQDHKQGHGITCIVLQLKLC